MYIYIYVYTHVYVYIMIRDLYPASNGRIPAYSIVCARGPQGHLVKCVRILPCAYGGGGWEGRSPPEGQVVTRVCFLPCV